MGGRKGFGDIDFWGKGFVMLYLVTPLVAIPETLLREVEGHEMGID